MSKLSSSENELFKNGSSEDIASFMIKNNLKNKSKIANHLGISRERVGQLFIARKDINFEDIKKNVTLSFFQNDIFKNSERECEDNYRIINTGDNKEITDFMISNNLKNSSNIGETLGLSRERIRQIFDKRKDINYPFESY